MHKTKVGVSYSKFGSCFFFFLTTASCDWNTLDVARTWLVDGDNDGAVPKLIAVELINGSNPPTNGLIADGKIGARDSKLDLYFRL